MSYDLLVFDPKAAPLERAAFLQWYESQNELDGGFNPTRDEFSSPKLRTWLEEMLEIFPAMNGSFAKAEQDVDDPHLTDYGINRTSIYACFAWSLADLAYNSVMTAAEKHGVGVYDVSNPQGAIWRPGNDGKLVS